MKEIIPQSNLPAQTSTPVQCSKKLMQCLIKLETPEKSDAKMELIALVSDLMPQGKPKYLEVIKYPMIRQLIETEGKKRCWRCWY
ncbi:MAG: hypothetical protein IPJ81_18165 [Chitinophagaceae bacterium]|nr:hypothetical protein [Chitinophagaceae bacterium]